MYHIKYIWQLNMHNICHIKLDDTGESDERK